MYLLILIAIGLIFSSIFYNSISYESRPLIPIYWTLSGIVAGPLITLVFQRYRRKETKFYFAVSIMAAMMFSGIGFFVKAQFNKNRHQEILNFPMATAQLVSCRSGEENPGKHRNPAGRFFPIWSYQFSKNGSQTAVMSDSNSISDFSIREKFKSKSAADAACMNWKPAELRQIYYDPLKPELTLMEIPVKYDLFGIDVFLGILFSLVSAVGLAALLKGKRES